MSGVGERGSVKAEVQLVFLTPRRRSAVDLHLDSAHSDGIEGCAGHSAVRQ